MDDIVFMYFLSIEKEILMNLLLVVGTQSPAHEGMVDHSIYICLNHLNKPQHIIQSSYLVLPHSNLYIAKVIHRSIPKCSSLKMICVHQPKKRMIPVE